MFERGKFLEALESILCDASSTEADVIKAMDVLMVLTQAEPGRIRQHVLGQKKFPATPASIAISRPGNGEKSARYSFPRPPGAVSTAADGAHVGLIAVDDTSPLLQLLIWRLVEDPDTGVQTQAVDLIRALLDFDGAQVHIPGCARSVVFSGMTFLFPPSTVSVFCLVVAVLQSMCVSSRATAELAGDVREGQVPGDVLLPLLRLVGSTVCVWPSAPARPWLGALAVTARARRSSRRKAHHKTHHTRREGG